MVEEEEQRKLRQSTREQVFEDAKERLKRGGAEVDLTGREKL